MSQIIGPQELIDKAEGLGRPVPSQWVIDHVSGLLDVLGDANLSPDQIASEASGGVSLSYFGPTLYLRVILDNDEEAFYTVYPNKTTLADIFHMVKEFDPTNHQFILDVVGKFRKVSSNFAAKVRIKPGALVRQGLSSWTWGSAGQPFSTVLFGKGLAEGPDSVFRGKWDGMDWVCIPVGLFGEIAQEDGGKRAILVSGYGNVEIVSI